MKTLTIELPDDVASAAEERAHRANMTLGEWITSRIVGRRNRPPVVRNSMGYPLDWFERTAGALADVEDLREPEDRPAAVILGLPLEDWSQT
jgi:hypothetical protein